MMVPTSPEPSPNQTREQAEPFLAIGLTLCVLGLALRWWRLDLMPFRFDAAEALARTRETLAYGFPPLTGIVNSLGFRNPAGLEWLILPSALLSPDPRLSAVWIAVLFMSGVWPMLRLGATIGGSWGAWLLGVVYTFHPLCVFASRDVWAQNLLPMFGAWALWCVVHARVAPPRQAANLLARAFVAISVAAAVHLSGVAWWLTLCGIALFWLRQVATKVEGETRPTLDPDGTPTNGAQPLPTRISLWVRPMLAAAALFLFLLPSAMDFLRVQSAPAQPKPDYVETFERQMPQPKPVVLRVGDSFAALFEPWSSVGATGGAAELLPNWVVGLAGGVDMVLMLASLIGFVLVLVAALRPGAVPSLPQDLARILLAWVLVPAVGAGVFMRYPNSTYLYCALPATYLFVPLALRAVSACLLRRIIAWPKSATGDGGETSAGSSAERTHELSNYPASVPKEGIRFRTVGGLTLALVALAYISFQLAVVRELDRVGRVDGPYYIPLAEQVALVQDLKAAGVRSGRFVHLAGGWFQRPYDYLLEWLAPRHLTGSTEAPMWGVAEDLLLRRSQPKLQEYCKRVLRRNRGSVQWDVFPSEAAVIQILDQYARIPPE
ncbi:MAG: hypothetical protein D6691_06940 [Candidatus Hydrogenedentota bacterium]|jgi:hypothetical protein|uniref:Glycosyltransferase RgtA/B/C/D-like domain-containing protein n=1 Tax=Sumerlaea chitinivorans TaxID=2250252 RepID=A0A2Z4Y8H6_SUMC1|nr:hypothetical protein BRCON_2389 [Candidatus Sumerlaea chitinivorans]MCX7963929.1 hypothetical protein [Candidatus Sumerlaea chitinivorans]RMH27035.1 MAG: hypothetical protein D6691_06940 [Candidatus Hydrogenedentota bacterium]